MIRISCKNERFTYDMYHIVKSFLPDAEISQKVDPEQELLIEMTAEEEPDLEEQACDKKVRWTFFHCREAEIADISEKREQKRYINKKLYQTLVKKIGEEPSSSLSMIIFVGRTPVIFPHACSSPIFLTRV